MDRFKEVWGAKPMSASGKLVARGGKIGGFLCTSSTSGTIAITTGEASGGSTIVASMSVAAGTFYRMPFDCPDGAYVTITNCAGTFAV